MQIVELLRTNAEWVAAFIGCVIAIGGIIATMLVWLWKLSAWIKGMEKDKSSRDEADEKRDIILTQVRNGLIRLETVIREREKDADKIEGALKVTRDDLERTNKNLGRVVESLKKLWETVEKPRRISDAPR